LVTALVAFQILFTYRIGLENTNSFLKNWRNQYALS
jgi:hypothetical protein